MSENEKRLTPEREKELRGYFAGRGPIAVKGQELLAEIVALRALLAEHRAEVERLTRQVDEARQMLSTQHDVSGCVAMHTGLRPEHICTLDHMQAGKASARDAALEEAKRVAVSEGVSDNRTRQQRAASARANIIAERIDALKSQPAERYMRESEVREVLRGCGWNADKAARRLGVDLSATDPQS